MGKQAKTASTVAKRRGARPSRPQDAGVRRERMLRAAAELFKRSGYHGAGVDDIARAAGMHAPAVYRHFGSKEKILVEIVERGQIEVEQRFEAALANSAHPLDALQRLVAAEVDGAIEHRDIFAVCVRELENLPADDRARITRRHRATRQTVERVLRDVRHGMPADEARVLVAAVFGGVDMTPAFVQPDLGGGRLREVLIRSALGALLAE